MERRAKDDAKAAAKLIRDEAKAEKKALAQQEKARNRTAKMKQAVKVSEDDEEDVEPTSTRDYGLQAANDGSEESSFSNDSDDEAPVVKRRSTKTKAPRRRSPSLESPSNLSFAELALVTPPKGKSKSRAAAQMYVELGSDGEVSRVVSPTKRRKVSGRA